MTPFFKQFTLAISLISVISFLYLSGCKPETDLGQACRMTKPCVPGPTCPIAESEMSDASQDYLSLGVSECDDLVCVRTANSKGNNGEGYGYCSKSCIDSTDCEYDYEGNKSGFGCQQLLLSESYMLQLKESNPEAYERIFGSGASSRYCVKSK
jgi:hypothetical protein